MAKEISINYSEFNLQFIDDIPPKGETPIDVDTVNTSLNNDIFEVIDPESHTVVNVKDGKEINVSVETVDSFVVNSEDNIESDSVGIIDIKQTKDVTINYEDHDLDNINIPKTEASVPEVSVNDIVNLVTDPDYNIDIPQNSGVGTVKKSNELDVSVSAQDNGTIKVDSEKLELFTNNLLPYIFTSTVNGAADLAGRVSRGGPSIGAAVSIAGDIVGILQNKKYLTEFELIKAFGANFYLLNYFRGIKAKKHHNNFLASEADVYQGEIDIRFGKNIVPTKIQKFNKFIESVDNKVLKDEDPNIELSKEKAEYSPSIDDIDSVVTINKYRYDDIFKKDNYKYAKKEIVSYKYFYYVPGSNDTDIRVTDLYETKDGLKKEKGIDGNVKPISDSIREVREIDKDDLLDSVKAREILNKNNNWNIGALYVMPLTQGTGFKNFYIPFEFNPNITEAGSAANYQAASVLSRIGNLHSFTGVNSNTVTLSTTYFALHPADGEGTADTAGDLPSSWMTEATLENIQAIELAYRSLTLPTFPDSEGTDSEGYKYIKPPLVRVIMGDGAKDTGVFSNLLTYQKDAVYKNKIQSDQTGYKLYKNFIVTNVTINKSLEAQPLYIGDDGSILDTFGFEVQLSLTEIAPSYMDQLPDFKSYYNGYTQVYDKYTTG